MTRLRAVSPGEVAPPAEKLTVVQAAATGDTRKLLVAMRERIAQTVSDPECPPRDLAALTRRLQDIGEKLDALARRAEQEGREGVESPDEGFDAAAI